MAEDRTINRDKAKQVYDAMSQAYDMPSEEEFYKGLQLEGGIDQVHSAMSEVYDVEEIDVFRSNIFEGSGSKEIGIIDALKERISPKGGELFGLLDPSDDDNAVIAFQKKATATILNALDLLSPTKLAGAVIPREGAPESFSERVAKGTSIIQDSDFEDDPGLERRDELRKQELLSKEEKESLSKGNLSKDQIREIRERTTSAFDDPLPQSASEKAAAVNSIIDIVGEEILSLGTAKLFKLASKFKKAKGVDDIKAELDKVISQSGKDVTEIAKQIDEEFVKLERLRKSPEGRDALLDQLRKEELRASKKEALEKEKIISSKGEDVTDRAKAIEEELIRIENINKSDEAAQGLRDRLKKEEIESDRVFSSGGVDVTERVRAIERELNDLKNLNKAPEAAEELKKRLKEEELINISEQGVDVSERSKSISDQEARLERLRRSPEGREKLKQELLAKELLPDDFDPSKALPAGSRFEVSPDGEIRIKPRKEVKKVEDTGLLTPKQVATSKARLTKLQKSGKLPSPKISGLSISPKLKEASKRAGIYITEKLQDSFVRVKKLQEVKGVKLKGKGLDPYETEVRYRGRLSHRLAKASEEFDHLDKSILKAEKDLGDAGKGLNIEAEVQRYAIAKHAPERNAALGKDKTLGITDAEAKKIISEVESSPHFEKIKDVYENLRRLDNQVLDILKENEVITSDLHKKLRSRYKHHIGAQRILDDTEDFDEVLNGILGDDVDLSGTPGKGFGVKSSGIKSAKGSEKKIDNLFVNTSANLQQAIVRAEKNIVNLSILDFARNNKHLGLFEEVKPKLSGFGLDKKTPKFDASKLINDKNILVVREKGKPVYLKIKNNSLAAVMRGVGAEELSTVTRIVGKVTGIMSQTATRFNPAFQIPNTVRDTQELATFLAAHKDFGLKGSVSTIGDVPSSMKDIVDHLFLGKETEGSKLYRQLREDGGTTGGLASSTREQAKINYEGIKKANRSKLKIGGKGIKDVVDAFDNFNAVFEDATRLSVYRGALKRGFSREEAATLAKTATIDFNKKGTMGVSLNSWFAFANASIQGSTKMSRLLLKNKKVSAGITSTVLAASYTSGMWNDAVDPEWRDKAPQWERNNNLVIVIPSSDGEFRRFLIPVSWGIKPIKTMSDYAYDIMNGHDRGSEKDIALGIASSFLDSYNPVGGSSLRQAITPTIFDIPSDIAANETWFGKPIKPESPFTPNKSEHKKFFPSLRESPSGQLAIDVAEYLDTNAGISISPQVMKYAITQLAGGSGKFIDRSIDTISKIGEDPLAAVTKNPVSERFFKETPEDVVKYYELKKKLNDPSLKELQKASDNAKSDRSLIVRDAFENYKASEDSSVKRRILKDLANTDPVAYKSLKRRIRDSRRGIGYHESALKDLQPDQRAEIVAAYLSSRSDKKDYFKHLKRTRIIDLKTLKILRDKYNLKSILQEEK